VRLCGRGRPDHVDSATPSIAGDCTMNKSVRMTSILTLVVLLAPLARAADEVPVPNINKRGDDEKKFVEKMAKAIVTQARTSVKAESVTLKKYEKKEPAKGRTEFHVTAEFKGRATKKEYTATFTVFVDTLDKDKWAVDRIKYEDDSKNVVGYNRKNVDKLVDKLNGK
jgi:hypothetical protein